MAIPIQINISLDAIRSYCEKWGIRQFALFGSVLGDDFHKDSDVDVLVTFADDVRYNLFDLVQMEEELATLFGRKVDLIDRYAVDASPNYIRRKEVLGTAKVIYAT